MNINSRDVSCVLMYKCSYAFVGHLVTDDVDTMVEKLKNFKKLEIKGYDLKGSTTEENNLIRLFDRDKLVYWTFLTLKFEYLL